MLLTTHPLVVQDQERAGATHPLTQSSSSAYSGTTLTSTLQRLVLVHTSYVFPEAVARYTFIGPKAKWNLAGPY
jgi:hypothetical protein